MMSNQALQCSQASKSINLTSKVPRPLWPFSGEPLSLEYALQKAPQATRLSLRHS